ncbi:olfactory receptor 1A1 [Xenopus tropicalis]|uniref:Olfactory receptor 1A1 n=2 Tax=Xenopus tropicalis TaxID=8364 RepID=A0A8J1J2N3_XENTR|nr:olfactory receptor 1A1 [Xenopus tropicalis]
MASEEPHDWLLLREDMANGSGATDFVLMGFPGVPQGYHIPISLAFFVIYMMSLGANGTVIALILPKRNLHQPMYILVANLALSDLLFDTVTLPKIIAKYWFGDGRMSFSGCYFQMSLVHLLGSLDSYLIMLMAGDRLIAIGQPLRYAALITPKVTLIICFFSLVLATGVSSVITFLILDVPFCGKYKINSCFCSRTFVVPLICSDLSTFRVVNLSLSLIVLLVPLAFIILSYVIIIGVINSSLRSENLGKMFYTCTTHLLVTGMYYIPRLFLYVASYVRLIDSADADVLILCLYTFLPHVANPVIYCLRNKEIQVTLRDLYRRKVGSLM